MWFIEISFKYTSIVARLMYDTKEEAEAQRNTLLPKLGKDSYDFKRNSEREVHTLTDKYGTCDLICSEIKTLRVLDADGWNKEAMEIDINNKLKFKDAGV